MLACFGVAASALTALGVSEGYDQTFAAPAVLGLLFLLGASAGPVQPIAAELAVETAYPCDENAVEATQQLAAEADARSVAESELGSTQKKLGAVSSESEQREAECKELKQSVESLGSELHDAKGEVKRLEKKTAELEKKLEPKPKPKPVTSSGVLGAIDLDEGPDAPPISAQIADALRNSSGRVLDLFREWDADGDGEISRKEFHAAMPKLGLEVPKDAVNKLFDEWGGKDGSLEFKELSKILKAPRPAAKTPAKSSAKK